MNSTIFGVLIIGFSVGLRTFTGPAVIAWAASLGWINLDTTPLSFVTSPFTMAILSLLALAEYVYDVLPKTPPRTGARGLIARFISGSFSAACLLAASGRNLTFCILGGVAAIGGAFAGYEIRTRVVNALGVKDAFAGLSEDIVAVATALSAVCLVR